MRDWLLFFVFAGLPIVAFWLQGLVDTPFFSGMLVIFLIMLLWIEHYHPAKSFAEYLRFDENLHFESFLWIGVGIAATFFISSFVAAGKTAIWVPTHQMALNFGTFQLSPFWNDVLFQVVLVAPAEELTKLSLHIALYLKLKGSFSPFTAKSIATIVPIFFWAMLHVYRAYVGPEQMTLLLAAFMGGIVIFAVMWMTKSLMGAILVHAGYNVLILWMMPQQPAQFILVDALSWLGKMLAFFF